MTMNSLPELSTPWHTLDAKKALEVLQSDQQQGLTSQGVAERLERYGPNELQEAAGRSNLTILIDQFKNIMLLMLIAVAVVSATLDIRSALATGSFPFPKDAIAIMTIVILNGILGFVQESGAEKALASLKKLSSPRVRVIRDGKVGEIASEQVVPGDVMLLEAGVQVAADGRLIEESNLQIRESALTGEAHAVDKQVDVDLPEDTPLGDRLNLVYRGTEVVQGRATVLVTRTGMHTELGRIASMLESVETEETPLQRRMDQLGNVLVSSSLGLVALVVLVGILRQGWGVFEQLLEVSLSMAVAVVPEGLPAAITVTLALGTQRMVKRNALIRKLPAVETLGSVTVICSDKTGTLTQNKMVVQRVETENHSLKVTGEGYSPQGEFLAEDSAVTAYDQIEVRSLLIASALCNDSILQQEEGQWRVIGDPTEGALLPLAAKAGIEKDQWASRMPRIDEFPFSSERKRMSVICQVAEAVTDLPSLTGQAYVMFTKGSPELILERCAQVQTGDRTESLTPQQRERILEANNRMAGKGLRVLGFAYKSLAVQPASGSDETTERELVWLGLVGMLDAPRPEVRDAVARCRTAGIRPVMITGDHQLTAQAIAEDLGISHPGDRVLTGRDLEKLNTADLEREVLDVSIYARVAPEHKLKIVQALQRRNNISAMTGDGVNDAPALKQADIGIAMGITGTDVSKEASDMVLLDDNFATIVAATEEGRVVYTNIRRFIKYILGSNIGEVLVIASSPLLLPLAGGVPLTPLQILWMNLVTDGLPALALAVEPAEPNVMNRPPHNPNESIFSRGLGAYMVRIGIIFTVISISLMLWAFTHSHEVTSEILSPERWKTMVFTTLCIAQLGHALAIRSNTQLFIEMNPFSNRWLLPTLLLTAVLQLCLIYLEPLRAFFGTHYLSPSELFTCFGFSSLMFFWVELEKVALRLYARFSGKAVILGD